MISILLFTMQVHDETYHQVAEEHGCERSTRLCLLMWYIAPAYNECLERLVHSVGNDAQPLHDVLLALYPHRPVLHELGL